MSVIRSGSSSPRRYSQRINCRARKAASPRETNQFSSSPLGKPSNEAESGIEPPGPRQAPSVLFRE